MAQKEPKDRFNKKKFKTYILIDTGIDILLVGFVLLYSQDFDYIGFMDAFLVAGFLLLFAGWMIFVTNAGIFDLLHYGMMRLTAAIARREPKKSYEDIVYNKEKINKEIYIALWVVGGFFVFISLIMLFFYYVPLR